MSVVIPAAIIAFLTYFLLKILPKLSNLWRMYSMSKAIPGPSGLPGLGNAHQIPQEKEMGIYFTNLAAEYAKKGKSMVRVWFAHNLTVIPITGKAVKDILDNNVELTKSSEYDIVKPWLKDGLLLSIGDKWKSRRRMITPTFHFAKLDGYISTMEQHAIKLTDFIHKKHLNETVDFFKLVKRTTLDIICDTAMGIDLNSLENVDHPYAKAVADMGTISTKHGMEPWLWIPFIWNILGYKKTYDEILNTLNSFTDEVIKRRKEERKDGLYDEGKRKAFLDMLLDMEVSENLTHEDIQEQVDTFLFAGILFRCTKSLSQDMTLLRRLSAGVFGVWQLILMFRRGAIRKSKDVDEISLDQIKELHYLEQVMKETSRVNPSIPFVGRHLTNDLQMDGYSIPKGANVFIAPLMIHRNPEIYPDPLKFDPDRFLPEETKKRHAYDFIPFSAGPRNCIGQKFAMYEAKILLARLIKNFTFKTTMKFSENLGCPEIIFRPEYGIPVRIEKREF